MGDLERAFGLNEGYLAEAYERYRRDPASVGVDARQFFEARQPRPGEARQDGKAPAVPDLHRAAALQRLLHAIREEGHRAAAIDPLGLRTQEDGPLRPDAYGLTDRDLEALPAVLIESAVVDGAGNARAALARIRSVYSGATGYEFAQVESPERRAWLHQAVESGTYSAGLDGGVGERLLQRLTEVETFEVFLHRNFPGRKWFSIEGNDMLVPLLDELLWLAAHRSMQAVGLGMAHRGRLNILVNLMNK
ncbi:MAG: 2-oxoglutarate dehydrogenase E1 component, partial [Dehalococcoidia bacterium]